MEVRAARRSERDEVLDLLALWFDDREFFERYNRNDPRLRDELCLVALDGGRIVSTVQIFDRPINLCGELSRMGGIGSVFTREEYRHKGVASTLMRLAVETMTREGFEASLLFAERLTFYNLFGWREVGRKFSVIAGASAIRAPDRFEIDVFEPSRDLSAVASIHKSYSGRFDLTAIRDRGDWTASLIFAGNQPEAPGVGSIEHFVLARERDAIQAYARATRFHGVSMIMEYGYSSEAADAMVALFKYCGEAAAATAPTQRLVGDHPGRATLQVAHAGTTPGVLVSHTAHDPGLEQRLAAAGAPTMHHIDNNYMWRVIAPERLAKRLDVPAAQGEQRAFEVFASDRSLFWTADRF